MVVYFQVLHPDGQPTTGARAQTFQRYLPVRASEWWVTMDTGDRF